jgi:lipopolysaccharide export system protein LptA
MLLSCFIVNAQKKSDTTVKKSNQILILDNDYGEYIKNDTSSVNKLIGNVKLLHGSDTLYCDSAYFYTQRNGVEAFGDVLIRQLDGTEASADYMRYNGKTKVVYMRADDLNDVQLFDGKLNTLWSKEIDYNLQTKIGKYHKRGFLQTETTVVESNTGEYNMKSKDARFKGNVIVTDPEYRAVSEDLGYNTDTKVARFFAPSVVTNDKSILQTSNGVYDTKNKTSHFVDRSSILNEGQYIEGDTLDYNRNSGYGYARGNVIAIDTGMKSILYCGAANYNEIHKTLLAFDKPLMRKTDGKDSMFIKADTFFSAPDPSKGKVLSAQDSLQQTANDIISSIGTDSVLNAADSSFHLLDSVLNKPEIKDTMSLMPDDAFGLDDTSLMDSVPSVDSILPKADSSSTVSKLKEQLDQMVYNKGNSENKKLSSEAADTMQLSSSAIRLRNLDSASQTYRNTPQEPDTSGPRYFVGYHHVLIYNDSMQGKCDSIRYSQVDSFLRMYQNPVLWPKNGELLGDVIYMKTDSNKLKQVIVPKNAIMINRSGPEKANMFDQIQGNSINGYLSNNNLDSMIAEPEASSIYFVKDEDSAYVGSSEAKSETIKVFFKNEEIDKIYYIKDVEQKTTPMKDVAPASLRLSRYKWREEERPKTLEEFLNGTTLPHSPSLLEMYEEIPLQNNEEADSTR